MPFFIDNKRHHALSKSFLSVCSVLAFGFLNTAQAQTEDVTIVETSASPEIIIPKVEYQLPKVKLTPQIIGATIGADLLLQRGNAPLAYQTYMSLALTTGDPRYADLAYRVAAALGDRDAALISAQLLKKLAPNAVLGQDLKLNTDLQNAYGLLDKQRYLPAYEAAKQILAGAPDNLAALNLLADVANRLGRNNEALAALEKLIKLEPNNPEAQNALGYLLADQNIRLAEAEHLIKSAYQQKPDAPHIIDSMAWIAYRQGRLAEALKYAEDATQREADIDTMVHYAEILWMNNKHAQSLEVFKDAYTQAPLNPNLRDTLERLAIPVTSFKSNP